MPKSVGTDSRVTTAFKAGLETGPAAMVEVDGQIVLVQRAASIERFADAADTLEALASSRRWSRR